jgi:D-alanine-D-alanine ligase
MTIPSDQINNKNNYQLPKHVGIIYSFVKREYFPTEEQYVTEKDAERDAGIIAGYLEKLGIKASLYPGNPTLADRLLQEKPDMVFNLVDSVKGIEYLSSSIPGVLELLEIPYTGAGIFGLSLSCNKFITKKVLQSNGIPVPNYQLFNNPNEPLNQNMRFPLISKLNEVHGSVEMSEDAISENEKHLRERLKKLITTYDQPMLVEEYIVGREIAAMNVVGLNTKIYCAERVFNKPDSKYIITTFEDQWSNVSTFKFEKYSDPLLNEYVKRAFETVGMEDYGKFDVRVDTSGRYFFIDSNCNPAFGPKELETEIALILGMHDVTFSDLLKRLMINTIKDAQERQLAYQNHN